MEKGTESCFIFNVSTLNLSKKKVFGQGKALTRLLSRTYLAHCQYSVLFVINTSNLETGIRRLIPLFTHGDHLCHQTLRSLHKNAGDKVVRSL